LGADGGGEHLLHAVVVLAEGFEDPREGTGQLGGLAGLDDDRDDDRGHLRGVVAVPQGAADVLDDLDERGPGVDEAGAPEALDVDALAERGALARGLDAGRLRGPGRVQAVARELGVPATVDTPTSS
jgi:hypothetical protein